MWHEAALKRDLGTDCAVPHRPPSYHPAGLLGTGRGGRPSSPVHPSVLCRRVARVTRQSSAVVHPVQQDQYPLKGGYWTYLLYLEQGEEPATADADGLRCFLEEEVLPWFENRKKELASRAVISGSGIRALAGMATLYPVRSPLADENAQV
jgi:hypothetical protein